MNVVSQYLKLNSIDEITHLYKSNKKNWKKELNDSPSRSFYVKSAIVEETKKYALHFFQNDRLLVHVKDHMVGWGNSGRKVTLAVDFYTGEEFAVLQPSKPVGCQLFKKEAERMSLWKGNEGLLELFEYYYDSESQTEMIITPKYDGTLRIIQKDQIKLLSLKLFRGLAQIHKDGYLHTDLKNANILIKRDSTGNLTDAVICDFESCKKEEELIMVPSACSFEMDQFWESARVRQIIQGVYWNLHVKDYPSIFDRRPDESLSEEQRKAWWKSLESAKAVYNTVKSMEF